MKNNAARNIGSLLILGLISFAYLLWVSEFIPSQYAVVLNIVLVPGIIGLIGFFSFRSSFLVKMILIAVIPTAHLIYFGGDPAKPGLENIVAIAELLFFEAGLLIGALWAKYGASAA